MMVFAQSVTNPQLDRFFSLFLSLFFLAISLGRFALSILPRGRSVRSTGRDSGTSGVRPTNGREEISLGTRNSGLGIRTSRLWPLLNAPLRILYNAERDRAGSGGHAGEAGTLANGTRSLVVQWNYYRGISGVRTLSCFLERRLSALLPCENDKRPSLVLYGFVSYGATPLIILRMKIHPVSDTANRSPTRGPIIVVQLMRTLLLCEWWIQHYRPASTYLFSAKQHSIWIFRRKDPIVIFW